VTPLQRGGDPDLPTAGHQGAALRSHQCHKIYDKLRHPAGRPAAAYLREGYKNTPSACDHAARLVTNGNVKKALADLRAAKAEKLQVTSQEVLAHWLAIANANPNELIELRRICCRFCQSAGSRRCCMMRGLIGSMRWEDQSTP
jgi:hypothetical protein